jgi:hypothetical protein
MNNWKVKKLRKQCIKSANRIAKGSAGREILRLARNRDVLGIALILENIAIVILFFVFILPLIK